MCVQVCIYISLSLYIYVYIHIRLCISIHVRAYMVIHTCIYAYIHTAPLFLARGDHRHHPAHGRGEPGQATTHMYICVYV